MSFSAVTELMICVRQSERNRFDEKHRIRRVILSSCILLLMSLRTSAVDAADVPEKQSPTIADVYNLMVVPDVVTATKTLQPVEDFISKIGLNA